MAKVKKFELEKKYVDYFNSVREELIKAEDTVSRIKGSKEWKRLMIILVYVSIEDL